MQAKITVEIGLLLSGIAISHRPRIALRLAFLRVSTGGLCLELRIARDRCNGLEPGHARRLDA